MLVAADHLLARITPTVGLWPASRADPLGDYLAALERTAGLAPRVALPGHGDVIGDPGGPRARATGASPRTARRDGRGPRRRAAHRLRAFARALRRRSAPAGQAVRDRRDALARRTPRVGGCRERQRGRWGGYLYCDLINVGDDLPPSTSAPRGRCPCVDRPLRHPDRRDLPARARERGLRDGRVRPRDGAARPARGASAARRHRGAHGASTHGRPGPLHQHRAGGHHVFAILLGAIGEPLISDLMEPPLSNTVAFLIAFAILSYLSVVARRARAQGGRAPEGRAARDRARRPARLARADHVPARLGAPGVGERRSSACCESSPRRPG